MIGALHVPKLQLVTIGVTLLLMVALTLFLKRTRYGVQMRAAAEDFRMARYVGVRANFVIGLAFSISGILATVASLLYISQTGGLSFTLGVPLMLFGLIATVVGGMGSLIGAVVGGFAVGFVSSTLQAYLPEELRVLPRRIRIRDRHPHSAGPPLGPDSHQGARPAHLMDPSMTGLGLVRLIEKYWVVIALSLIVAAVIICAEATDDDNVIVTIDEMLIRMTVVVATTSSSAIPACCPSGISPSCALAPTRPVGRPAIRPGNNSC